ncbi:MAG: hypothetical protein ABSE90_13300, partial [Verrucomicrobiota bacterium]
LTDGTTDGDCGTTLPLYRWKQTISPTDIDGLHAVDVQVENSQTGAAIYELETLLFEPLKESSAKPKDTKPKAQPQ